MWGGYRIMEDTLDKVVDLFDGTVDNKEKEHYCKCSSGKCKSKGKECSCENKKNK